MQLGTRWNVGDESPGRLPEVVKLAIEAVEDDLSELDAPTKHWRWTLTWLEGQPVLELDDGTTITYDPVADEARITEPSASEYDPFDED